MSTGYKDTVQENSYEWNEVAYKMQMMTGKSSLKMVKVIKYVFQSNQKSPNVQVQRIAAFIDLTEYKSQYRQKIINKVIPLEDVLFLCGHFNLKKYHQPNKIFTFMICKIALGKIGRLQDPHDKIDSVFVPGDEETIDPFHFNFLLTKHSQYEVCYEVSFVIGEDSQVQNKDSICSLCEYNFATIYCKDQKMYFCGNCNESHHRTILSTLKKNMHVQPHQIQKINRVNSLPLCENHSVKNQYYCIKCEKYVCQFCIQKGIHHQNQQHKVKPIEFLYEQKQQNNQLVSLKNKQKLQQIIGNITSLNSKIKKNYQKAKYYLEKQFEAAKKELDLQYFKKSSRVYSDQIWLNMMYEKIQWSTALIMHEEKFLKPINYFKIQARFEEEMKSFNLSGYEELFSIKADLDCSVSWFVGNKADVSTYKNQQIKHNGSQNGMRKYKQSVQSQVLTSDPKSAHIMAYNPNNEAPKRGELSIALQNSSLQFFKFKPTKKLMNQ